MGLTVLKYRIFCPFPTKMQVEGFNFFMLSPANMGHFFLSLLFFFADQNANISSLGCDECLNSMV